MIAQDFDPLQKDCMFFGPHALSPQQIFYGSLHSRAFVNLKPIVPGRMIIAFSI